jgi:hypothetical protein
MPQFDDDAFRTVLGSFTGESGSTKLHSALGAEAAYSGLDLGNFGGVLKATFGSLVLLVLLNCFLSLGTLEFSDCKEGGGRFGTRIIVAFCNFFFLLPWTLLDLTYNQRQT